MNLLNGLNDRQAEAVQCTEGPLLILAGAGSGKTKTIIHRIAYIIENHLAWPSQILAITFTNKAAGEMRDRIAGLDIPEFDRIWVHTFHALCARIMRMYAEKLGYGPGFVIYDTADQKRLYKQILKDLSLDEKYLSFAAVTAEISDAKNRGLTAEIYYLTYYGDYRRKKIAEFFKEYEAQLRKNNAMDFDDLISNTLRLFKKNPDVLTLFQNRFKYILVDEYQDTNHNQFELTRLLAGDRKNICVCGDDDQSIYAWRGADISNILDFEKDYPEAKTIKLTQNYRSTQVILDAANGVISHNRGRKEKALWTTHKEGEKIVVKDCDNGYDEAFWVADEVHALRNKENVPYGDIAVLYRTNAQSRMFEEAFHRENIPYRLVGGLGFYSRLEIKDILSYLNVLVNPSDDLSLIRIINVPKRAIGSATIEKLQDYAEFKGYSLLQAVYACGDIPTINKNTREKVSEFGDMIRSLAKAVDILPVSELIQKVIVESGYMVALEEGQMDNPEGRIDNLNELISSAAEFEKTSDDIGLLAFLETAALTSQTDTYEEEEGSVLLMTLHNAKGLEFPIVFLPGLEEGVFPHQRALDETDVTGLEEERRICYVGITRAKKRLFVSSAHERTIFGRRQYQMPSRFIDEIPQQCIQYAQSPRRQKKKAQSETTQFTETQKMALEKNFMATHKAYTPTVGVVKASAIAFAAGDRVSHKKFGVGTVIEVKPSIVSVAFPGIGIKKLAPEFVTKA